MKFYLTLFLFLIALSARAQKFKPVTKRDSINRTIGYVASWVKLDKITPLPTLIRKLAGPWELVETGKGYWIGYTDDMFSIANYGDAAVEPLMTFFKRTKSRDGRAGVVYTLHLIGIKSSVAGRFIEKFQSIKAREALLTLLKYEDLGELVMPLLRRDPWLSDVPELFATMQNSKGSCAYIIGDLSRYLKDMAIKQPIPAQLGGIKIKFPSNYSFDDSRDLGIQSNEMLQVISRMGNPHIEIDPALLKSDLTKGTRTSMKQYFRYDDDDTMSVSISQFLERLTTPGDFGIGDKMQYYVENNILYICTPATAKERLIEWWRNQSAVYKDKFKPNSANQNLIGFDGY